jgi:PAS domain S-box-containing protein
MVRQLFELIGLLKPDGTLLEVNQSALDVINFQKIDVLGQVFWETPWWQHSPDIQDQLQEAIAQAARGASVRSQVIQMGASQVSDSFQLSIKPVQDEAGRVQFLMLEGHADERRQKQDAPALKASEAQLNDILNTAIAAIGSFRMFANGDREYLFFSAGTERVFGYSAQEMMADKTLWLSRVHPEDKETILMPFFKQFFTNCPGPLEFRFYHKDGSLRWISTLYTSRPDLTPEDAAACAIATQDAAVTSWIVTAINIDITDRKQAEAALQQQIRQEQLVVEIAQYIRQSLNLEEVLRRTVERVRQYLQTDRVIIFRFEQDWQGITVMESVGPGWMSLQSQTIDDACFRERYIEPYRLGRVSSLSDISAEGLDPCYVQLLESMQIKANIVVPVLQGKHLWGLLIAHHCTAPRQWQADEMKLLQQLSTHLSIAVQQSELYQQVHYELLERRQVQNALQESEVRFRALSDSARIGIFQAHMDGTCVYTNACWQALAGLSWEESLGEGWVQAIHPADRASVIADWKASVQDASEFTKEFRLRTPQGLVSWILCHAGAMRSATGEMLGYVGTQQDITQRKQAEATLQKLNQELELKVQQRTAKLEQLLEQERVLGAITQHVRRSLDLDEILTAAVTEVRQVLQADRALIFRLNASDGSGVVIKESVLPEYPVTVEMRFPDECFPDHCYEHYRHGYPRIVLDVVKDEWADCLVEFMGQVGVKTKIIAPIVQVEEDGSSTVWGLLIVHSCAYPRQWQPIEAELVQQISNQLAIALKQSELHQQLQNSETRLRSAFDNAGNGMAMLTLSGHFMRVNSALCEILGYSEFELLQLQIQSIIQPEEHHLYLLNIQDLMADRATSLQIESALLHKSGEFRWTIRNTSLVRDYQGNPLHLVVQIQDITERRALEQMKSEFISIVSHELRTPLTSIRGSLGLLVSGVLDHQPDTTKQMIEIAAIESERLVRLVNDILDLERLENKKITLNYQWCSATDLMLRAIESLQLMATENKICLELVPVNKQVWADPDRIIQVLVNLISNAIKFSSSGSTVWIKAQIQDNRPISQLAPSQFAPSQFAPSQLAASRLQSEGQVEGEEQAVFHADPSLSLQMRFEVEDQGTGIPADKLDIIFDRFQQVNASDSRDKGGTGLGLSICRNIIQQHGGHLWVDSILGQGSVFYFTLPLPSE